MSKNSGQGFRMLLLSVFSIALLCLAACAGGGVSSGGAVSPLSSSEVQPVEKSIEDSYRDKLQEYAELLGLPQVRQEGGSGSVEGLAYAELVDFGAGDYLVVCYRESAAEASVASSQNAKVYVTEVWTPDEDGVNAVLAYASAGQPAVSYARVDGKTYLMDISNEAEVPHGSQDDVQNYLLLGIGEDGSFGVVESYVRIVSAERDPETYARLPDAFAINGEPATADEWMTAMDERNRDAVRYPMEASVEDLPLLEETQMISTATLESLEMVIEPSERDGESGELGGAEGDES